MRFFLSIEGVLVVSQKFLGGLHMYTLGILLGVLLGVLVYW